MSRAKIKQLAKLLEWASKAFISDTQALKACVVLQEKCEYELEKYPPEEGSTSEGESGGYPLPQEVQGLGQALVLFTDGACRGNPGPGSWAAMGQLHKDRAPNDGEIIFEASGVDVPTTNNRMELSAALNGLRLMKDHCIDNALPMNLPVLLFSDSKYLLEGLEKWVPGWKARGWKKADNKVPENVEIWKELDQLAREFKSLRFHWVKGHAGHPQNEHVDAIANKALDEAGY